MDTKETFKKFLELSFFHSAMIRVYEEETYFDAIIFDRDHPDYDREDADGKPICLTFTLDEYTDYILNMLESK